MLNWEFCEFIKLRKDVQDYRLYLDTKVFFHLVTSNFSVGTEKFSRPRLALFSTEKSMLRLTKLKNLPQGRFFRVLCGQGESNSHPVLGKDVSYH